MDCTYCQAPLPPRRTKYCGSAECKRARNRDRMREYNRKHKATTGKRYSDRYGYPTYTITCAHCGYEGCVRKATARYCSHDCWQAARHAVRAQVEPWKPRPKPERQPVVLAPLRRRCFSACCPMCRTWFVTDNPKHVHCTRRCGRKASKDRERARMRQAFVAPVSRIQVYERDHWTCQLCRKPVRREAVVPHPQAPVLDHVIPLARGGTHEPANVQLAHYSCNSIKQAGSWPGGEQLMLIG